MTFNATDVNVTCCNLDGTPMSVTCGQGLSCAASCFSLEATLCPSHNCEDCATFGDLTNDDQRQRLALASWNLKHCPGPGFYCMVGQHQQCCFHPLCRAKKWQKKKCSWLQYHTGRSIVKIQRISLHDLPSRQLLPTTRRYPAWTVELWGATNPNSRNSQHWWWTRNLCRCIKLSTKSEF